MSILHLIASLASMLLVLKSIKATVGFSEEMDIQPEMTPEHVESWP